jgi:hypothetical protein
MITTGNTVRSLGTPGVAFKVQDLAQQADANIIVFEIDTLRNRCMPSLLFNLEPQITTDHIMNGYVTYRKR